MTEHTKSVSKVLRRWNEANPEEAPRRVQLPPRPRSLLGRDRELTQLVTLTRGEGRGKRVVIYGPAGVGKTSLALHVAHEAAETGGYNLVLWLDCQRSQLEDMEIVDSPTALISLADIIRELSLSLSLTAAFTGGEREHMQVVRSRLASVESLLVVDDIDSLHGTDIDRFLLSLSSTTDIVATSRSRRKQWLQQIRIRPLSRKASKAVLAKELQDRNSTIDEGAIRRLVKFSGGNPLALIWVGTLAQQGYTSDALQRVIRDPKSSLQRFFFDRQWESVRGDIRLIYAIGLIAIAGPINRTDAARALSDSEELAPSNIALTRLVDMSLLQESEGQLKVLPLTKSYAIRALQKQSNILERVYCMWLQDLNHRAITDSSYLSWHEIFERYDVWRLELLTAFRWVERFHDKKSRALALDLVERTAYYAYSRGLWASLQDCAGWTLHEAINQDRRAAILEIHLTWIAQIQKIKSNNDGDLSWRAEWLDALVKTSGGDHPVSAKLLLVVLASHGRTPEPSNTVSQLEKNAMDLSDAGWLEWSCRSMLHAGNIYADCEDWQGAYKAYKWIVDELQAYQNSPWGRTMTALAFGNLGVSSNKLGLYKEAIQWLEKSKPELVQAYDEATLHGELALAYDELNDDESARHHMRLSMDIKQLLGVDKPVIESRPHLEESLREKLLPELASQGLKRFLPTLKMRR